MKKRKDGRYLKVVTINGKRLYFMNCKSSCYMSIFDTSLNDTFAKMDIKQEDLQFIIYNSRCDVFATITSEVGTIVNLLILIIYVVSKII